MISTEVSTLVFTCDFSDVKLRVKAVQEVNNNNNLCGHSLKLNKKTLAVAKFSFINRIVNEGNLLDEEIISGCSLADFKRKLDRHLRDKRGYI